MSAIGKGPPPVWRSRDERARPDAAGRSDEFPTLADGLAGGFDRRQAMKLAGAALALGGLAACDRPEAEILPYVDQPEGLVPGVPRFYATTLLSEGYGIGALVESHEGRPTKVEGNPAHPASLGATDAVMQAACLDLFDPQRSRLPLRGGQAASHASVGLMLAGLRERLQETRGEALAVLTGPTTSPTFHALMERLRRAFPGLRWYRHEPLGSAAAGICGKKLLLRPRLSEAKVIVSLDADFLGEGPGKLAHARDFAARRSVTGAEPGTAEMNRLYAVETTPTITGAMADHRWSIRPDAVAAVTRALAALLTGAEAPDAPVPAKALEAMAEDLRDAGRDALVLPGPHLAPEVQRLAVAMNEALGSMGRTLHALPHEEFAPAVDGDLADLVADLGSRRGLALLLETNPVYTAPGDLDVVAALAGAESAIHLGRHVDETAVLCDWHVPAAHPLESWGDARAFDGTASPVQPLIRPLYDGRTPAQVAAALLGTPDASARDLVAGHWEERGLSPLDWRLALRRGVFEDTEIRPVAPFCGTVAAALDALPPDPVPEPAPAGLELRFAPDPYRRDGAYATNAWLLELPRPLTKMVWGNAAAIAPATARTLGVEDAMLVQLAAGAASVVLPAHVQPGHPEGVVTVTLGHGRWEAGEGEHHRGVNAYPLRAHGAPWSRPVDLVPLGVGAQIIGTQHHHSMEGRHPVRHATLHAYREDARVIHERHPPPPEHSLYPDWEYPDHAWGMVIDQTVCIGCNACVAACQAENNIPTVGPEQCAMGREMHWLRVDRYFAGPEDAPHTYFQPVPCMHCEKAPCEVVCPVNATVHTNDGLNAQVYNRCIGTRYCSQNCPYKVRRFNFLSYQPFEEGREAPTAPVMNPNVSVRSRGVMEKCTYCVQRISAARIQADIERRPIAEGEVVTACQAACPTEAIRFGDLNQAGSTVRRLREHPLNYALLAHLNTRPRTTYLGRLSNPHPALHEDPGGSSDGEADG